MDCQDASDWPGREGLVVRNRACRFRISAVSEGGWGVGKAISGDFGPAEPAHGVRQRRGLQGAAFGAAVRAGPVFSNNHRPFRCGG